MSVAFILWSCVLGYIIAVVVELMLTRKVRRFLVELVSLGMVLLLALLVNNASTGRVAFGEGTPPVRAIVWMFVATLLGIAARYIFYMQKGQFSWLDLAKPISISPIVLLPLIGSVQATGDLKDMQMISFAFLAFQNGFFWQAVLEGARPAVQSVVPPS